MNCRGLGDKQKRRDLFHLLKTKQYSICCLQDTHFTPDLEKIIRAEWGYDCYFSSFNSRSRGVCCLIQSNFEHTVRKIKGDIGGNFLILDLLIKDLDITLINIYGPNSDSPSFYDNISEIVKEFDNTFKIFCGDWNLIQNPLRDMKNYFRINNPQAREKVLNMIDSDNLVDPWRYLNPEKCSFTWRQRTPLKQSRLDFFLISKEFIPFLKSVSIEHGYRTDHSMVVMHCNFSQFERGRGVWRFNNSLLRDMEYVTLVKSVIKRTLNQYSTVPINDIRNLDNENITYNINDQLLFETVLMEIRGESIKYSSTKKKRKQKEEKELELKIKTLNEQIGKGDIQKINELEESERKLQEIRVKIIEGVMVRSRARWVENGEKPTKYFCGLEKRNFVNKTIEKVELGNGTLITDQKQILKEVKTFYEKLYAKENLQDSDFDSLELGTHPILSNQLSETLEGPLTLE